ncbi:TPA: type I-C CRISPR-associated protein Cas5c [Legionella pneumophila]|uniref:pre-crRNA processing endonuclease n=1 Tax=Legionella pneumophila TaxID=446 RepID=A0AAN5R6F7_LEGPN|nr:type I-C CRISPR-associated protein Cas5 [Legionella pneumophila]HAT1973538.1 type I-C CRISPR-associated protein Cas5 [Legionella pneumophila]HAT6958148.1 type I-C CRISPR-associated protein Cas5 [Legionella pneumophila]HBD7212930.1 type I-C CRISPR-associated protein Cas5 [Legionella pneumophila]HCC0380674.1 type I-C CRISPR-associated protein Cas5 [Legionella pneumophila]
MPNNYCLEVRSAFACFTRPEMKVERVSYDIITPSAARAIFEAIFWKPAISWRVTRIDVLNPIRWASIRRNEVGTVMTSRSNGMYIEDERQQRASLLLRDVRYRIYADLIFDQSKDVSAQYGKYTSMFERRAEKGQCFNQPYLGCREFSCDYRLITHLLNEPLPIAEDRSFGWMLYDMDYHDPKNPTPRFFNAQMNAGVLQVPAWDSEEVKG